MIKIENNEIIEDFVGGLEEFPKYTTQLINLANQNAQGTRPRMVRQMSDLIQEFPGKNYDDWIVWYGNRNPNAIENATNKIYEMVKNLQGAIELIDIDLVRRWVKDLVLTKTYTGFCFQESILKKIASLKGQSYRLSEPTEESRGIDGFIGGTPVSIKPTTYKTKNMLTEQIEVTMIYYEKVKDGIKVYFDL